MLLGYTRPLCLFTIKIRNNNKSCLSFVLNKMLIYFKKLVDFFHHLMETKKDTEPNKTYIVTIIFILLSKFNFLKGVIKS